MVDILRNQVSQHASHQDVGRKMLMSLHPGQTDGGRGTIGEKGWNRSTVLVCKDPGDGPRNSRVFGGERSARMEKGSAAVSLIRTLPLQRILQSLHGDQSVQSCFARKKTSFTPAVVVRGKAQEVESGAAADESGDAVVGNAFVMLDRRGILIDRGAVLLIGNQQSRCDSSKWNQPVRVR